MNKHAPQPPRYDTEQGQWAFMGKWYDPDDIVAAVEEYEAAYEMYWDAKCEEERINGK